MYPQSPEEVLDPLKLELKVTEPPDWELGIEPVSLEDQQVLLATELSLYPCLCCLSISVL